MPNHANIYGAEETAANLAAIGAALDAARADLQLLISWAAELESQGMFAAVPHEQWQDRNGRGRYLYLLFPMGRDGRHMGPGGKRKLYVGNKADRISRARDKAVRRQAFERYQRAIHDLDEWIYRQASQLNMMAKHYTKDWPGHYLCAPGPADENWGRPAPAGSSPAAPKDGCHGH